MAIATRFVVRRRGTSIVFTAAVALVMVGCSSGPSSATSATRPSIVPASVPVAEPAELTTMATTTAPTDTGAVTAPVTAPDTDVIPDEVDASDLPPMEIVAALGYPRDLLDRGRVNLEIRRDDDVAFVIYDKQLVADHFDPAPVEERRTVVPSGRVLAVQTLFGEATDCDSTEPLTAVLRVTFTVGDDPVHHTTALPLTDTSVLEQIRFQQCTVANVLANNDITLENPVVDGETMTVDLVVRRLSGDDPLAFDSIKGTVLFGAASAIAPGAPDRVLDPAESSTVIPLTLDVNRCDSHAVAETTRKFGIDLYVSVDGAESQRIDVPIESIRGDLEAMLERCKVRTGQ